MGQARSRSYVLVGVAGLGVLMACTAAPSDTPEPAPSDKPERSPASRTAQELVAPETPPRGDLALGAPADMPPTRGIMPLRPSAGVTPAVPFCTPRNFKYWGGPVIQNVKVVAVFWTSNVNAQVRANIGQFYADVTNSSYFDWLSDYNTAGL